MTVDVELLPLPETRFWADSVKLDAPGVFFEHRSELFVKLNCQRTVEFDQPLYTDVQVRANVAHATAAKDAEIEALRAKTAVTMGVMDEQIEPMVFWNCPLCDAMYQDQISECDCKPGARTINEVHLYSQQSIEALRAEVERLTNFNADTCEGFNRLSVERTALITRAERLAEALRWALPLASQGLEMFRLERLRCGHRDIAGTYKNGETWAGIHQEEVDGMERARAALEQENDDA